MSNKVPRFGNLHPMETRQRQERDRTMAQDGDWRTREGQQKQQ